LTVISESPLPTWLARLTYATLCFSCVLHPDSILWGSLYFFTLIYYFYFK
jgi:hypothetical protein